MEASFDNKTNLFNTNLRSKVDDSVLYTFTTKSGYRGRKHTIVTDANPAPGHSATAGVIHWKEEALEIGGQRKTTKELKETVGSLFKKYDYLVMLICIDVLTRSLGLVIGSGLRTGRSTRFDTKTRHGR